MNHLGVKILIIHPVDLHQILLQDYHVIWKKCELALNGLNLIWQYETT